MTSTAFPGAGKPQRLTLPALVAGPVTGALPVALGITPGHPA